MRFTPLDNIQNTFPVILSEEYLTGFIEPWIGKWRKQTMEGLIDIFKGKRDASNRNREKLTCELYCQIGQLRVENEWLKKIMHHIVNCISLYTNYKDFRP